MRRSDGGSFSVFGPFHRAGRSERRRRHSARPAADDPPTARLVPLLHDVDRDPAPTPSGASCSPGPGGGRRPRGVGRSDGLSAYDRARDRLDLDGTSRLSQTSAGACCRRSSPRSCAGLDPAQPLPTEIAWRDFYAHLLFNDPGARSSFRPGPRPSDGGTMRRSTPGEPDDRLPDRRRACASSLRPAGCTTGRG